MASKDLETTHEPGSSRTKKNKAGVSKSRWIIENVASLGLALLIVFMIRSSVVEAFKIPSGSMIPTLHIGDHIFVNKMAYGLKVPFSDLVTDHPIYFVHRDPPKRGDIIVFIYPKDESYYYIKRVIGVPGDTIELKNKILYINQQAISREPIAADEAEKILQSLNDPRYSPRNIEIYREKIGDDSHQIMIDKNNFMAESFPPTVIPPESLFVMGDNRDFSNDSRFWGFVPFKNVKGKAMVIWLSLAFNFSEWQFTFRPERIGTVLH